MQTTALFGSTVQPHIVRAMQSQPSQNMFVQPTVTNSSSQVHTNSAGSLYRGPSASPAPRNGTRHVPIPAMYPQTMHQSVVVQPFPQYQRQAFPAPSYAQYPQPLQPNYPYPYPSYYPVPTQRGAVGVTTGVSNTMTGPNGPMPGPPGATQTQMPLAPGTVLSASAVPTGTNPTVLGVAPNTNGQQVAVQSIVGVVQTTLPTQAGQKSTRRRLHAIKIIDPNTNKDIFEDYDGSKTSSSADIEYTEQNIYVQQPIVMAEQLRSIPYEMMDMSHISRDGSLSQTPIVSAISDGPSVEILTSVQKPRSKKILPIINPKDGNSVHTAENESSDTLPTSRSLQQQVHYQQPHTASHIEEVVSAKSDCVRQQLCFLQTDQQQSHPPLSVTKVNQEKEISADVNVIADVIHRGSIERIVADGNHSQPQHISSQTLSTTVDTSNSVPSSAVALGTNRDSVSLELQQQLQTFESNKDGDLEKSATTLSVLNSADSCLPEITTNIDDTHLQGTDILGRNMQLTQDVIKGNKSISNIDSGTEQSSESDHVEIETKSSSRSSCEVQNTSDWEDTSKVDYNTKVNTSPFNEHEENQDRVQTQIVQPQSSRSRHFERTNECDETDHQQLIENSVSSGVGELTTHVQKFTSETAEIQHSTNDFKNCNVSIGKNMNANEEESTSDITCSENNNASSVAGQSVIQEFLISYNEGQWSPNNPSGKKQYDKVQLLKLREAIASRRQPEVKNVSILPTPNLMPSFIRQSKQRVHCMGSSISTNRGVTGNVSGADGYGNKQASMSGVHGRGSLKANNGMILVNLSLNQDVKLNETDNAWRPRILVKCDVVGDPEAKSKREKEELIRRIRGILNKLTPEKFDALVEEIIKLKIDTPDKMEDVMVLVFEKAIDEPNFSVSYARLCHRLISEVKRRDERMESGTKTNLAQFRAALLDKTEREFTYNVTKSIAKEKKLQPIIEKIAECTDLIEKAELEAQLEEEERKIRRRSGGTVRFIGELFKISMLTGKIINSCIDALLNPNSEDQLECLCKLLTTVGEKFEQTPINTKESTRCYSLEKTMNRMQAIASKTDKEGAKVSSRVRFMLQDVIDLRRDKWQSKRNEAPKTMGQVEKEMKTEQLSSQYLNYAGTMSGGGSGGSSGSSLGSGGKRDERGGGGRFNDARSGYGGSHSQRGDTSSMRRQQPIGGNSGNNSASGLHFNSNGDDSTWHVQTSKGGSRVLDPLKLEGLSTANNFDNKKMGGVGLFVWSNGSRQSSTASSTPTNSFAALSTLNDTNRSNDRDRSGPRNKGSYNKGSIERDRYGMLPRSGSSQTSRENSSSRGAQQTRSALITSSVPKTSSHNKYLQQQMSSNRTTKLTGAGSSLYPQRGIDSYSHSNLQTDSSSGKLIEPPVAVFEKLNDEDILVIKSVVSDMVDIGSSSKTLKNSVESCILRVKENQRCALISYIMTDYLHLRHIGKLQRRYLGNVVVYLIHSNFISVKHFKLAYKHFCEIASDLSVDIPNLWEYIIQFTGPLISRKLMSISDLWSKQLKEVSSDDSRLGKKFLQTYLAYCLSQIGPSFTRTMWKKSNSKWTDFMPESDVHSFIQTNKFEYIENDKLQPTIVINGSKDDHIAAVAESVEHLLKEEAPADCIIDYINGNIFDIGKQFIRSLATKLCDFAISYRENSYKLEVNCFQKVCIPVLQRYIDSKEEFELECLYAMQLLVARLEHPRGLLSDLFGELYDADVIPQDSFIKWRDSKDQSAGKGVAVKGLNPFFTHILSSETSDENN
ncbi:eukaryotic translation initiation factor 4 gamma 3 isoform X1 [Bactrocera tryoni]|uniref:eukaryotic translation initiation factor 4 gamma 3 isoform X1 n=1 Tax=Bactrocera tryoni TaxID=59916 RepID=UPI001A962A3B|nr:eukaryotic translation initiation factor 4 gamma 3 isoform X1 [Bactrocera tryoni]XP_039967650.1 eukaryotic translation initiation factor 4 gamma 3 isoform X1 [Bactrocera tryoni]XP_039967651.1 eukaryotic translation initiation factor 4 gamma 3 isoform X1 [Bactrocera tryoni]XP_039967653.1 eukaryotic translation initiation factor 4 gamma 3 isoform X1 [Bactrocera tryoni]XP_039967654.1 eukaryotic translation initiation factor 4 gamma 3 isoform X1 [Bactrocera tryoni]